MPYLLSLASPNRNHRERIPGYAGRGFPASTTLCFVQYTPERLRAAIDPAYNPGGNLTILKEFCCAGYENPLRVRHQRGRCVRAFPIVSH